MIRDFLITSFFLVCANIWALDCSAPVTISDPRIDGSHSQICANENGDAVVIWTSHQKRKHALTSAYKIDSSSWTSPENISDFEEKGYCRQKCFFNADGDLFTIVGRHDGDSHTIRTNEKKRGQAWTSFVDWIVYPEGSSCSFDIGFDGASQNLFVSRTTERIEGWFVTETVCAVDVSMKPLVQAVSGQTQKERSVLIKDKTANRISNLSLIDNQSGLAYIFWVSHTLGCDVLKCQKMQNGQPVLAPVAICNLGTWLRELKLSLNKAGDVVLGFLDATGCIGVITKTEDTEQKDLWSSPVILETGKNSSYAIQVAIDELGNSMIAYTTDIEDNKTLINAHYKSKEESWLPSISFSSPHGPSWNPQLETDGKGNFILVWQEEKRHMQSIYGAAFSTTTYEWAHPQLLSPEGDCCFGPSLTFFTPGKGYISWTKISSEFDLSIQVAELTN